MERRLGLAKQGERDQELGTRGRMEVAAKETRTGRQGGKVEVRERLGASGLWKTEVG